MRKTEGIHMLIKGLVFMVEADASKSDRLTRSSSVSLLPGSCNHKEHCYFIFFHIT